MRRLKSFIISWDLLVTLIVTIVTYYALPNYLDMDFVLSIYNMSITILSIIFSLFFAALAIIMSSSENDFIDFLEETKGFSELLWSFKITLIMLFVSLIYSIVLYTGTSYCIESYEGNWLQRDILFLVLTALFTYSMSSTCISVYDTIKFSEYRSKFERNKKE